MAPVAHRRDHWLAGSQALDPIADLTDPTRGLVAHHVGVRRHHPPGSVEQVAALDAHGLHLDQDATGPQLRIGDVDVLEDLGPAGPGVGGCLHGGTVGPTASDRDHPGILSVVLCQGVT
jgi:hypothetical protein